MNHTVAVVYGCSHRDHNIIIISMPVNVVALSRSRRMSIGLLVVLKTADLPAVVAR